MDIREHENLLKSIMGDLYVLRRRIERELEPSRERSLALTKIDEAAFWIGANPVDVTDGYSKGTGEAR